MQEELTDEHYDLGDLVLKNNDNKHEDKEYDDDDDGSFDDEGGNDDDNRPAVGVKVGGNSGSTYTHYQNHRNKQHILPGVFLFIRSIRLRLRCRVIECR